MSVKASGTDCTITSIAYNQIKCRVNAVSYAASVGRLTTNSSLSTPLFPYTSGPGVDFKTYSTLSLENKTVDGLRKAIIWNSQSPTQTNSNLNFNFQDSSIGNFATTVTGYLKVPVSGNYVFRASFEGRFSFYLSNVKGSAEIADYCAPLITGESDVYNTTTVPSGQRGRQLSSNAVNLTQGDYVYYEAYFFSNNRVLGQFNMSMDVTPTGGPFGGA